MAHEHTESLDRKPRSAAGEEAAAARPRRIKVTPMGVLEILMWCAGAGAILGFWLWQRGADLAPTRSGTAERDRRAAVVSKADTEMRIGAKLGDWHERFRAATEQSIVRHADLTFTGSTSAAPEISELPIPSLVNGANTQTGEPVVPGPNERVRTGEIEPQEDEVDLPAEAAVNDQNGVFIIADAAPSEGALPRVQIPLPPEAPSLDFFGLPENEAALELPEALTFHFAAFKSAPAVEPPQVIVPDIEVVLTVANAHADRGSELQPGGAQPALAISSAPSSVDRDTLITRGEAALSRGDLAAARLFFGRAATAGDARGARGMGRTFDPDTFRKLRVIGMRPDPDEAARWYARSDSLQMVASTR